MRFFVVVVFFSSGCTVVFLGRPRQRLSPPTYWFIREDLEPPCHMLPQMGTSPQALQALWQQAWIIIDAKGKTEKELCQPPDNTSSCPHSHMHICELLGPCFWVFLLLLFFLSFCFCTPWPLGIPHAFFVCVCILWHINRYFWHMNIYQMQWSSAGQIRGWRCLSCRCGCGVWWAQPWQIAAAWRPCPLWARSRKEGPLRQGEVGMRWIHILCAIRTDEEGCTGRLNKHISIHRLESNVLINCVVQMIHNQHESCETSISSNFYDILLTAKFPLCLPGEGKTL